jgi:[ribosomal protein S5]-alanine N-acetyltransferase
VLSPPNSPLTDGVVTLRPWRENDLGCVLEAKGFTEPEADAWIRQQWQRGADGAGVSLAIADARSDEAVGCVGLQVRTLPGAGPVRHGPAGLVYATEPGTVAIGYWVIQPARRRGLASRAVRLTARWAVTDAGLKRVEAVADVDNRASHRVLEHAGFRREGRLRSYLVSDGDRADALIFSLLPADLIPNGP